MDFKTLKTRVQVALELLSERDASLIKRNVSEWSISHRLAVYLEYLLPPGWDIDCEYNRQKDAVKTSTKGKGVRPDISVHHRRKKKPEHNLLVIELKKSGQGESDVEKVKDYTAPPEEKGKRKFQYQYGLAISLKPCLLLTWFEDGKLKESYCLTFTP